MTQPSRDPIFIHKFVTHAQQKMRTTSAIIKLRNRVFKTGFDCFKVIQKHRIKFVARKARRLSTLDNVWQQAFPHTKRTARTTSPDLRAIFTHNIFYYYCECHSLRHSEIGHF